MTRVSTTPGLLYNVKKKKEKRNCFMANLINRSNFSGTAAHNTSAVNKYSYIIINICLHDFIGTIILPLKIIYTRYHDIVFIN